MALPALCPGDFGADLYRQMEGPVVCQPDSMADERRSGHFADNDGSENGKNQNGQHSPGPENGRARGRNASAGGIWNTEFACDDEFMDVFYHWYCRDDFFYGIAWIEKEEAHSSVENDDADLMLFLLSLVA